MLDNKKPDLYLLVGIPGSGKSSFAEDMKKRKDCKYFSSDLIREELYGNAATQGNPSDVFTLMQRRSIESLKQGENVIYDATNISRKSRSQIIQMAKSKEVQANVFCYLIWAPIDLCIERDSKRSRTVGRGVIERMVRQFQAPFFDEGIDCICLVNTAQPFSAEDFSNSILNSMKMPHDNPHHSSDIYMHCMEAYQYLKNKDIDISSVLDAALYHDIGKPRTKSFTNAKGELSESAHYYQHQAVGAYLSYGLPCWTPELSWLISSHMEPFFNSKYYKNLSEELKYKLDLLHEADLSAH